MGVGAVTGMMSYALIAALVVIVLTQGYGHKGILGKIMGIGGSLYNNITGYFSDILSYSRLMALMLAGAVIAPGVQYPGRDHRQRGDLFLISAIGNALNFALQSAGMLCPRHAPAVPGVLRALLQRRRQALPSAGNGK